MQLLQGQYRHLYHFIEIAVHGKKKELRFEILLKFFCSISKQPLPYNEHSMMLRQKIYSIYKGDVIKINLTEPLGRQIDLSFSHGMYAQ